MLRITFPGTTFFSNLPLRGQGHLEVVKILLETGKVNVTAQYNYSIRNAAQNGKEKM